MRVVISALVDEELAGAPAVVQSLRASLPDDFVVYCDLTDEVLNLRDAYLRAGVLSEKWRGDATHVAFASVFRASFLVSWNFKHLVRFDKVKAFQAVNLQLGYPIIQIISPPEVRLEDEDI